MPVIGGTVYIWYPENDNIGHASLHIGSHKEDNDSDWYVSWWPDGGGAGLFSPNTDSCAGTLATDIKAEEDMYPHVRYEVYNLNIPAMKSKWDAIRNKPDSHYKLYSKNCATIVARVLRAGGADKKLNLAQQASYAHNLYWSPRNVAEWCQQLTNSGYANKFKHVNCPAKKDNRLLQAFGLR